MTLPFYKPLYFWHEAEVGLRLRNLPVCWHYANIEQWAPHPFSFSNCSSDVVAPVFPAHVRTGTPEKVIQEPVVTVHSAVHGPGCASGPWGKQVP